MSFDDTKLFVFSLSLVLNYSITASITLTDFIWSDSCMSRALNIVVFQRWVLLRDYCCFFFFYKTFYKIFSEHFFSSVLLHIQTTPHIHSWEQILVLDSQQLLWVYIQLPTSLTDCSALALGIEHRVICLLQPPRFYQLLLGSVQVTFCYHALT